MALIPTTHYALAMGGPNYLSENKPTYNLE